VTCDVFGGDPAVVLRSILNKQCEHLMGVITLIVADVRVCWCIFFYGYRSWFHPEVDDVLLLPGAVVVS
jgi:hypothetical protein